MVKRIAEQMIIPCGLLVLSVLLIWKWPFMIGKIGSVDKIRAFLDIMPVIPYSVYLMGILMGWRYNNTGMILTSVTIFLIYLSILYFPAEKSNSLPEILSFLFPLNFVFHSMITKKRIFSVPGCLLVGLILLQTVAVLTLFPPESVVSNGILKSVPAYLSVSPEKTELVSGQFMSFLHSSRWPYISEIPTPSVVIFLIVTVILSLRLIFTQDILVAGYLGSLVAVFLGFNAGGAIPETPVYFMAAGLILLLTNIEASFFKAYVDELTGLHGRRSLNETMANLGRKYAIAMMDIDHFKKFNDTYGHKTGDDVLKMVARKLEKMSGGCKTFRYGGEEFTAVFPGKTIDEAVPHLESFRYEIENSLFTVRSRGRKKSSKKERGRGGGRKSVRVTISIGVAGPARTHPTPGKVIKTADKALYKAKRSGRNCVRM